MKTCILISLLFYTASAFKYNVHLEVSKAWDIMASFPREKCILQTGVDRNAANVALLNMDLPEDYPFKCFSKCIFVELGFYNPATDTFNSDRILKGLVGIPSGLVEECSEKHKGVRDQCERVFSVITCGIAKIQSLPPL
ncbi:hypothetical protein PPYR_08069 [Photinus pyralis]|uniref:Uncharacterized protein n=1 Tax=Photinus pyralis TaxID=7054 RepID=A0A5N4AI88_PHOPY|nr:uncharacterized protein LOC116170219 [Photinus pyralis]XP_031346182.1 uncharacterized protein LOC116173038 [Photinus pyralis]KAB0795953.1 hypothetical protein PPYR_10014 [Photinus pyralis]KAB0797075.1 hypothetical protein PPYR_08069 [Photinus pyralis]